MAILRRSLLAVGFAAPVSSAPDDARRAERSLGNPHARQTVVEWFSLTCPHCAAFARDVFPDIRARWITPGNLRWVFDDFPTDMAALQAAMVARYLPPDRYERFLTTLFVAQDRWAYVDNNKDALWRLANDAGMDRATFERAVVDTELRDWIVGQAMDAESRWHVSATPSFLIADRVYEGAMPASEFARLLAR